LLHNQSLGNIQMHKSILFLLLLASLLISIVLNAQETNSHATGRVLSDKKEVLSGATVTVIHEPTQNKYISETHSDGYFYFFNLKPGGPYSIVINSIGYESLHKKNLYIHLNSHYFLIDYSEIIDFIVKHNIVYLQEVVVNKLEKDKIGSETIISLNTLQSMPTISRSIHDFIRIIPQAKVTGDGAISLAGQNNRFNAFFIDGASNNDLQGLAVNGTNGGLTGSSPVSIEAIEEVNVLLTPYNVQYGTFTGGSINAITRSGSNENKSSLWYYFRNSKLAGRSPKPMEKPGSPGEYHSPRLSPFLNQTYGAWNSGALLKDKFFYFALFERQADVKPQPFNFIEYRGVSNQQQLIALTNYLQNNYNYNPGPFLETKDALHATRMVLKFDWNASATHKLMLSYRYNNAERTAPRLASSANAILFQNNGIILPATTHSASFEWKHFLKKSITNRLLLTYTNQVDDRKWIGQTFPSVSIFDGIGSIVFGSESNTGIYDFKANDITLFNAFKFIKNQHVLTLGLDVSYGKLDNISIPSYFGNYQFRNLNDFMNNNFPSRLQRSFPLDETKIEKREIKVIRSSFFINDEIRLNTLFKVNFGIRFDIHSLPLKPPEDNFFNDTAINIISKYYDLAGARSGKAMNAQQVLSPRIGIDYKIPKYNLTFRGGAGIFVGHIVNFWAYNIYNSGIGTLDISPQQYGLKFNADPYKQPNPHSLNIDASNLKGALNLMAENFKYPSVFKTSVAIEKKTNNNWIFSIDAIITKNIVEVAFRNVNILPPVEKSAAPDSRNIYSLSSAPAKIPLRANGINPYSEVFLITNNPNRKGSSYNLNFIIKKQINDFLFNSTYGYGRSRLLFEITGPQTPILAQWRNMETVNGRNFVTPSISDNDLQHRLTCWMSKKIIYEKSKTATTILLFYNGQSGSPYSYVYNGSIINDNGNREIFDLIYIPTQNELSLMNFLPVRNSTGQVVYSSQQQKDFLNDFIEKDRYLRKNRGNFSERNGARLPFTHIIDLKFQQDFTIRLKGRKIQLAVIYDIFNLTNMLNKDWGHIYFLTNDSFPLIQFAGYANTDTKTPQYQFTPINGKPFSLHASSTPGNSARWISQLGLKININ
jgi:hypothetical protein